jgi:hypothetical protein
MLHWELAARLATSGVELQVFQKRKGIELQPVRYELLVTLFSAKKNGPIIMLHMTPHQTFTFGLSRTCSMMLCGCCDPHILTLCLVTAPETWKVASSVNMMFCRKAGVPADSVKHVAGKIVSPRVVLWFQLLQDLHLVRIEAQPISENLMPSFSWHLQLPWSSTNWLPWTSDERHTDVLYVLIGDGLSASSVPFQDPPSLQKPVVPSFEPLCACCCFPMNTTKLPLHPRIGFKLRTPKLKPFCVKWQQRPNGGPFELL